uniref:Uncharacterized protein n=1 Tax=Aureoumbra lagunensis TaxID=44058 RepID=A0A7S3K677_9STRA|mmetsp:Transcript_8270/g.10529  ORF Transcript_8270/g.10529 Transcript_8270/m.10529 type:complete len:223 (-) Transcript_8270:206-874(-)
MLSDYQQCHDQIDRSLDTLDFFEVEYETEKLDEPIKLEEQLTQREMYKRKLREQSHFDLVQKATKINIHSFRGPRSQNICDEKKRVSDSFSTTELRARPVHALDSPPLLPEETAKEINTTLKLAAYRKKSEDRFKRKFEKNESAVSRGKQIFGKKAGLVNHKALPVITPPPGLKQRPWDNYDDFGVTPLVSPNALTEEDQKLMSVIARLDSLITSTTTKIKE